MTVQTGMHWESRVDSGYRGSCVSCLSLINPDEAGRACSRPRQWKHGHERARLTPKTEKIIRRLQKTIQLILRAAIVSATAAFCKRGGTGFPVVDRYQTTPGFSGLP